MRSESLITRLISTLVAVVLAVAPAMAGGIREGTLDSLWYQNPIWIVVAAVVALIIVSVWVRIRASNRRIITLDTERQDRAETERKMRRLFP